MCYLHSRKEAEASVGQEEDDEEEEIGAADKDEQMCSAACLGRLSPARSLTAVGAQVTRWDGKERGGMGGMGGMGWPGMGWDRIGWDGMGWNGRGW